MPFLLLFALIQIRPALGQAGFEPPKLTAKVLWSHDSYLPGSQGAVAVVLDIEAGWHVYPGKGSPDQPESYIPTTVDLTLPAGWTQGRVRWPQAHEAVFGTETVKVYAGHSIVLVPFWVGADAAPGPATITATVGYQACDDKTCEAPTDESVQAGTRIVTDASTIKASAESELAGIFADLLSQRIDTPDTGPAPPPATGPPASASTAPAAAPTTSPARKFFGIPMPKQGGALNLIILAALSALGGFILNLTPCVLPVIPIKIMTIMQHANHPGRSLMLGLWMALGVIAFWTALGVPVAFFTGISDPSRLFGIWWLTLGIGVLIAAMGVGIMGLFTIQLPQAVYAVNPKADSVWGSFVFGVMTGVLGLPCFGFVAGALLVGVATMPPGMVMTIFTSLGVGMALPYIVLSANPKLLERLPRTGPASELVKQVMGLLLLAAAAFFIGAGLNALVRERPYLAHQLQFWAVAIFCGFAGLWLIVRTFQITSSSASRAVFTVVGLIIGSLAILYAWDATAKAKVDWEVRQAALAAAGSEAGYIHGAWNPWTPAAFEKARADGHVVVLDFTADWCINCKVIKAAVLNKEPVLSELNSDDVVKFTVDLTSTTDPGWDYLHSLGQTGIPLLVVYTPGRDDPWQSNAYTSQQVMDALSSARANRREAAAPSVLREYSAEAFKQARDSGAVVVLSFSAQWGINTQLLTRNLLKDDRVQSELTRPDTVGFDVDVTSTSSPGWGVLDELDQAGVPCVAVYGPESDEPWTSNIATPPQLVDAINRARLTPEH